MKLFLLGHLDIHTPFDGVVIQIRNIFDFNFNNLLLSFFCSKMKNSTGTKSPSLPGHAELDKNVTISQASQHSLLPSVNETSSSNYNSPLMGAKTLSSSNTSTAASLANQNKNLSIRAQENYLPLEHRVDLSQDDERKEEDGVLMEEGSGILSKREVLIIIVTSIAAVILIVIASVVVIIKVS